MDTTIREIDGIYRIGKRENSKNRPIIIKFLARRKAIETISSRKNLKGSKIYISEDLPKEVIEKRKQLMPILKKHKAEGKRVMFKYDKLFVDCKDTETSIQMKKRNRSDNEESVELHMVSKHESNKVELLKPPHPSLQEIIRDRANSISTVSDERERLPESWRTLFLTQPKRK